MAGGYGAGDPPDPIPNSEVKTRCADGTAGATRWESTAPPAFFITNARFELHARSGRLAFLSVSFKSALRPPANFTARAENAEGRGGRGERIRGKTARRVRLIILALRLQWDSRGSGAPGAAAGYRG